MHPDKLADWVHDHVFHAATGAAERGTRTVTVITAVMMVFEIAAGWWFNSMALLADGWHMSSHAVAIGLSALAYGAARRYARDPRFAFGTWKIEVLGGFASALFLLGVAALMVFGSVERLLSPQAIHYPEAVAVAVIGLIVNIVCAVILGGAHDHHDHGHAHHDHPAHEGHAHEGHGQHDHGQRDKSKHKDLNLQSAYIHVIADAATSVLAIVALIGGWIWGLPWLDPVMGIVGAVLIAVWAKGLIVDTAMVLLDREMDHPVVDEIREVIEAMAQGGADQAPSPSTRLTDLHVWRVGKASYACALTVVTGDPALTPARVRRCLAVHSEIVHSTIEVHWSGHSTGSMK